MPLTSEQIDEAARFLLSARGDFRRVPGLPDGCRPETEDDGYRIQDALIALWGLEVAGWKIGATLPQWQAMVGASGPLAGRLLAPFVHESPATLYGGAFHLRIVESEYAYRLGRDLPPRAAPYERAEVEDAVASVHPSIEIVDSRYTEGLDAGAPSLIADNALGAAFVYGPPIDDWRNRDLVGDPVRMLVDGAVVGEGSGAEAGGDPILPLIWLANDRSRRGDGLAAGQLACTSSATGIYRAPAECTVVADFGPHGRAELVFSD